MITEKTVELNLTTEWINHFGYRHNDVFFALGPSTTLEGKIGVDVAIQSKGAGILIQYKRAYLSGAVYEWQLNRTSMRDQHNKLLKIQDLGFPVYYGLPEFTTVGEVAKWRRKLLLHTHWHRPSNFILSGGPVGYHEVFYDSAKQLWWCRSEQEGSVRSPIPFNQVASELMSVENDGNLGSLINAVNDLLEPEQVADIEDLDGVPSTGPAILARAPVGKLQGQDA